jgi:hypothetical protein
MLVMFIRLHNTTTQKKVLLILTQQSNTFNTGFLLNNIYKFSSYLTGNTLCLRYKLMLFREAVAVYCENHMEHIDTCTLWGQNAEYVKAGGMYSNHWALKG